MTKSTRPKVFLSHHGTCSTTVENTMRALGARVIFCHSVKDAFADYDGILLLGGSDIAPAIYGQVKSAKTQRPDVARDKVEWILARRALADRKPILGICRGAQMLAAAAGGALIQDISPHRPTHSIWVEGKLSSRIPAKTVNSYHHQAIGVVPFGFDVAARGPGRIVEAIYRPGYLGVQWHPEMLIQEGLHEWASLFEWLVQDGLK